MVGIACLHFCVMQVVANGFWARFRIGEAVQDGLFYGTAGLLGLRFEVCCRCC